MTDISYVDDLNDMAPRDIADEYYEHGFEEGIREAMWRMSKGRGGGWADEYDDPISPYYENGIKKRGAKEVVVTVEADSSELAELKRLRLEVKELKAQKEKAVKEAGGAELRAEASDRQRKDEARKVGNLERLTVTLNLTIQDLKRELEDFRSRPAPAGARRLNLGTSAEEGV